MKKTIILGTDNLGKAITHVYKDKERGIVITNKEEIEELSKNAPEKDLPKFDFTKSQEKYLQYNPPPPNIDDIIIYEKQKSKFHK